MIGIVVVSHSHALARAAVSLATQMAGEDPPAIAVAAGLDDETLGTDATAVSAAVEEVASPDGVLVLLDLGSALMSTEMALEFLEPELAGRVRISSAPFVEGLVAAVVTAGSGAGLDAVAAEAESALRAKAEHLGGAGEPVPALFRTDVESDSGQDVHEITLTVPNKQGLHARPAAAFVRLAGGFDAHVAVTNLDTHVGPVDATSLSAVASLQARQGHRLQIRLTGPGGGAAVEALTGFQQNNFGDDVSTHSMPVVGPGRAKVKGPLSRLEVDPDPDGTRAARYRAGDPSAESVRLTQAVEEARARLTGIVEQARQQVSQSVSEMVAAQLVLLDDTAVIAPVTTAIQRGDTALTAWRTHLAGLRSTFEGMDDDYFRARGQDVASLERRVRAALLDLNPPEPSGCSGVVLVDELDAPTAVLLPETVTGVLTRQGGRHGHGVMAATTRGIPVVVDVGSEFEEIPDGEKVERSG